MARAGDLVKNKLERLDRLDRHYLVMTRGSTVRKDRLDRLDMLDRLDRL